jgi:RNA-splicing ligase RtcB
MFEIKGKHGSAKIFSSGYEEKAIKQVTELLNEEWTKNLKIRIMPDYHAGAGCVIGTTMQIQDKIVPNLVGVDIGCGMYVVQLGNNEIDFQKLDDVIREYVPSGKNVHDEQKEYDPLYLLKCFEHINKDRALKSVGTLGGGNHFIEIDESEWGTKYLIIHSGSRYLGKQVAEYYQKLAIENLTDAKQQRQDLIKKLKEQGREKDIQKELLKIKPRKINKQLAYLEGKDFHDYIYDMERVQYYAMHNRRMIAETIIKHMNFDEVDNFHTVHNYIDTVSMILRKGSVSAKLGEILIIPINMRDGCILAVGKGNDDYNQSAPHGAGRLMSRSQAKELVDLEKFKETMSNVWSTSVNENTLDESPMAYKNIESILNNITDTVDVIEIIKPVYNFKA